VFAAVLVMGVKTLLSDGVHFQMISNDSGVGEFILQQLVFMSWLGCTLSTHIRC
jgi:hypothetical protein